MTGKPAIIIVQRQTLDWQHMDEAAYQTASIPFCRLWERPDDYMVDIVRLWNNTFAISYFETRHRLKQLATEHNQCIGGTRFIAYEHYRNVPLGNGYAYVFIDDDDWLSPQLASALAATDLYQHDAGIWKGCTLGSPKSEHPLFFWGLNGRCMTNNYVVTSRWIQSAETLQQACKHSEAEKTVPALDTLLIDEWLSITNKAPCSSVSLENSLQNKRDPDTLANIIHRFNERMQTIPQQDFERAAWAWPLFESTRQLFADIANSRQR